MTKLINIYLIDLQVNNKDIFYLTPVITDLEVYHGGFYLNFFVMTYSDPSLYYVYATTDSTNKKQYIGIHRLTSKKGLNYFGSGTQLKQEILNKGKEKFSVEIIDWFSTENDALLAESYYIYNYESYEPFGYNSYFILKTVDDVYSWLQEQIIKTLKQ